MNATTEGVVARFATLGGAIVELHTARFLTKWKPSGPPWTAVTPYEVDGWNWRCGCGAYGREGETYEDPGFRKLPEARDGAQGHAEKCRAIAPPAAATSWEYLVEYYRDKRTSFEDVLALHCWTDWELAAVDWDSRRVVFKRPTRGAA